MTSPEGFILGSGNGGLKLMRTRRLDNHGASRRDIGVSCMRPDSNTNPCCSCVFLSKRDVRELRKGLRSCRESINCEKGLISENYSV